MMHNGLIIDIEAFCRTHSMSESAFGREALGDWRFIKELRGSKNREPRRIWPETERKVRHFMATYQPAKQQGAAA